MRNGRKIRISKEESTSLGTPILMLVDSSKPVMCSFDMEKNCRSNCAAFQALADVDAVETIVNLMCHRMSHSIGILAMAEDEE